MGKFLTGASRIKQTYRRRVWSLIDNELYRDDSGEIYLAPRSMYTDNYTIPMWIAIFAGSPVDYDVRASHIHDLGCFTHQIVAVELTETELKSRGFLKFNEKADMWICENIPEEYLYVKDVGKKEINDIFNRCMKACNIPTFNRIMYRLGVCFNFMFYVDDWLGRVFKIDLSQIYNESWWDSKVWYKK